MSEAPLSYLQSPHKKYWFDACKLIYHQDRLQDYLDGDRIMPIHIDIGIAKSCNCRCLYCYGIQQVPSPEYIPIDRLLLLVDDAKEVGIKSMAIIGDGEPTMNKGLYPMVTYAKQVGLDMSVATNGLLLDKDKIDILTSSLIWLRFNISGIDKYDYIHTTINGLHKIDKVIRYAVANKKSCTIGLQMVCIPQCFSEIVPLAKAAISWGVDYLVIKQYSDPGCSSMTPFDMRAYEQAKNDLRQAEAMSNDKTKIIVKWSAMEDTRTITMDKQWSFDRCIDLPLIFQISGNGKCYPCGYLFGDSRYCYGDITKDRLRDILRSRRYWEIIDKISKTKLTDLCKGQCRHCETNKFIDRLTKLYYERHLTLQQSLIHMCGGEDKYTDVMSHPPQHINFI